MSEAEISALDFSCLKPSLDEAEGSQPIQDVSKFLEDAKKSDIYEMSQILMERSELKQKLESIHPELRDC